MQLSPEALGLLNACTRREREFVRLLVRDPRKNQSKAYVQAGYVAANGDVAAANASRLIVRDRVKAAYQAVLAEYRDNFTIEDGAIVKELTRMAFADPRDLLDPAGRLIPVQDLPDDAALTIKELEVERTRARGGDDGDRVEELVKVKTHDKLAALRTLAQVKGMLTTKVEHSGLPNWEKVVAEASK